MTRWRMAASSAWLKQKGVDRATGGRHAAQAGAAELAELLAHVRGAQCHQHGRGADAMAGPLRPDDREAKGTDVEIDVAGVHLDVGRGDLAEIRVDVGDVEQAADDMRA